MNSYCKKLPVQQDKDKNSLKLNTVKTRSVGRVVKTSAAEMVDSGSIAGQVVIN